MSLASIRNFCIVAHIDHGKSTLADRILERTGLMPRGTAREQILDDMDLERERGITIKAKAVTRFRPKDGKVYRLNLIDTPGHVDFSYEVSRALAACEGAVLLVDASQGVEAQTVANAYLAIEAGLEILPVLNKIDLPGARPEESAQELAHLLGGEPADVMRVSAKTGEGVDELLDAIIARVPPPLGAPEGDLRALIFDSVFDDYRGVIVYVRVVDGVMRRGDRVCMLGAGRDHEVVEIGTFRPERVPADELRAGEVGYLVAAIKTMAEVQVGDTVGPAKRLVTPLPGYREPKPVVFCGLYPSSSQDLDTLRRALERLRLNDASFTYHQESSEALGFGFRCGFLGLLHMEIVQERLERESGVDIVQTAPNVTYEVVTKKDGTFRIEVPSELPPPNEVVELREPVVRCSVVTPAESIGAVMKLAEERRGTYIRTDYLSAQRVLLVYDLPLAEIVFDFHDRLKSATRGYGSFDYEPLGYHAAPLVRLRILVGGTEVDALSAIVHREQAQRRGRDVLVRLKKEIPRHLFEVALQAAIGGKIIARESIPPMRKNVIAKCYGGDVTRKRKLLEKQKEGKKRMKRVGSVDIPQKAFLAVLGAGRDS
jgi:GTP-binding protein LepA